MDLASTLIVILLCLGIAWGAWYSCCSKRRRRAPIAAILPLPAAVLPFVPIGEEEEQREPSMPSVPNIAPVTVV